MFRYYYEDIESYTIVGKEIIIETNDGNKHFIQS